MAVPRPLHLRNISVSSQSRASGEEGRGSGRVRSKSGVGRETLIALGTRNCVGECGLGWLA